MYLEGVILEGITQINTNRSIYGLYHILTGKKSIQSVYDARIFQVENYYGIYPQLSRNYYTMIIESLIEKGLLEKDNVDDIYRVTFTGKAQILQFQNSSLPRYLKGLKYSGKDRLFLKRFLLLFQTYSNLQYENRSFIPIIDDQEIANWLRTFYRNHQKETVVPALFEELNIVLSQLTNDEAELFVDRLTGYKHYGLSIEQLAIKYQIESHDVVLLLTGITHRLLSLIEQEYQKFSLLSQLVNGLFQHQFMTNTAFKTYLLLKQNYTIEEIAAKRKLKVNTILDHIVEIALYDSDFNIDFFVSKEEQSEIIAAVQRNNTFKLKVLKESCRPSISYFQIRLVLARWKDLASGAEVHG